MTYDIYFHDDFDGRASAAVMLNFLESRGDAIEDYFPIDYAYIQSWPKTKLAASGRRNPAIVVDFLYHPEAAIWFDHHQTSFSKKEWQKKFRSTEFRCWQPKAPSCCGLIVKSLQKNFGYQPPKHIKELARWLDIIDSAHFRSAKQTIEKKEPALQLEEFIEVKKPGKWFIKTLANSPLKRIIEDGRIKEVLRRLKKERKKTLDYYRKNLRLLGRAAYIDLSRVGSRGGELRFAPFYLYPKVIYRIILRKSKNGIFNLRLSVNPWRRRENKVHLGKFLRKNFGGGGHYGAGGAEFKSRKSAEAALKKVVSKFQ